MSIRRRIGLIIVLACALGLALALIQFAAASKSQAMSARERELTEIGNHVLLLGLLTRQMTAHSDAGVRNEWLAQYRELGVLLAPYPRSDEGNQLQLEKLRRGYLQLLGSYGQLEALTIDGETHRTSGKVVPGREPSIDRLFVLINEMASNAASAQQSVASRNDLERRRLDRAAQLATLAFTLLAAMTIHFIGRGIRAPLGRLAEQAATLAGEASSDSGEIDDLEIALDRISGRLQQLVASNQQFGERNSRQKRTESQLRHDIARLKKAQAIAHLGCWEWTLGGDLMHWSDETWRILGKDPEQSAARYADFIDLVHPDDRERVSAEIEQAIARKAHDFEHRLRLDSGEVRVVRELVEADSDETGRIVRLNGAIYDITRQTKSEQELRAVTHQCVVTLNSLQRRELETILLKRLNDRLQFCQLFQEAYPIIERSAAKLFPRLSGGFCVAREDSFELVANWGDESKLADRFPAESCVALSGGKLHSALPGGSDRRCSHYSSEPNGEMLCIPIDLRDEVVGSLHLYASEERGIGHDQFRLAISVADLLKLALTNLKLRDRLAEQVIRDPLTGLFNRRYLNDTLPREIQRMLRTRSPLSIAMLDIDHFKRFNDEYGHEAGDEVLKALAEILKSYLRASDISCRYGGEEFTVILPDSTLDHAYGRLQQIGSRLRATKLAHSGRELPTVTVSIGLIEAPHVAEVNGEALLSQADSLLYAAKEAGRDRIEAAQGVA